MIRRDAYAEPETDVACGNDVGRARCAVDRRAVRPVGRTAGRRAPQPLVRERRCRVAGPGSRGRGQSLTLGGTARDRRLCGVHGRGLLARCDRRDEHAEQCCGGDEHCHPAPRGDARHGTRNRDHRSSFVWTATSILRSPLVLGRTCPPRDPAGRRSVFAYLPGWSSFTCTTPSEIPRIATYGWRSGLTNR